MYIHFKDVSSLWGLDLVSYVLNKNKYNTISDFKISFNVNSLITNYGHLLMTLKFDPRSCASIKTIF